MWADNAVPTPSLFRGHHRDRFVHEVQVCGGHGGLKVAMFQMQRLVRGSSLDQLYLDRRRDAVCALWGQFEGTHVLALVFPQTGGKVVGSYLEMLHECSQYQVIVA